MARSLGGKMVGRAASIALAEQRQQLNDDYWARKRAAEMCRVIRDCMETQEEYDKWWAASPDDNAGFDKYCKAKLAELKHEHALDHVEELAGPIPFTQKDMESAADLVKIVLCRWCGGEIKYETRDTLWLHTGRDYYKTGDNGYYCNPNDFSKIAEPIG